MTASTKLAALTALTLLASAPGQATAAPARQCFRMSEMQGWRAAPDARSFYMRVRTSDIYQVDLSSACPALRRPNVHLVTRPINDLVCSAVEFDLQVADNGPGAFPTPCIVSGFRRLSPDEAKALSKKMRP
jgi:hypothetical protein